MLSCSTPVEPVDASKVCLDTRLLDYADVILAARDEWCSRADACVEVKPEDACSPATAWAAIEPAEATWVGPPGHWDGWLIRIDVRRSPSREWVQFVALHELGHFWGIKDKSDGSGVMASVPWHLTDADVEALHGG